MSPTLRAAVVSIIAHIYGSEDPGSVRTEDHTYQFIGGKFLGAFDKGSVDIHDSAGVVHLTGSLPVLYDHVSEKRLSLFVCETDPRHFFGQGAGSSYEAGVYADYVKLTVDGWKTWCRYSIKGIVYSREVMDAALIAAGYVYEEVDF